MIDIHTHILPGIDDGAKDLTESLALLKLAESDGITHMVATPHIYVGRFNNVTAQIQNDLESLKLESLKEGINVKLAAAAEVRLDIELMAMVMANKLPFIGKIADKNVLLLELPHSHMPQGYDKFIQWLAKQNIRVIIPHPERNRDIQSNLYYIEHLKQLGCDFQLTASSIEGEWGESAQTIALQMLQDGLVNYVASDAHSVKRRPPILSQARKTVAQLLGEERATALFVTNPLQLTEYLFND
ncbi:capsule biosynthesis protein CapC [Pseudoalteromonas sp. S1610]|uniref:tyrosine-protein phosphatase n=1 Tax=unclassified Pseudoalteromonas TaxID=194690 RepID=UPI00110B24F2|nr:MULTISPECIES: CpsB/CapC family capsule biosynthesis tyrosine phosphatase [unclassified Pseudoalteromonas]MCK8125770.1 capsule biosynthesis protein CapC [Pseudoalteromonas sp. 2CM39R]TMP63696.1 capsule biosynthesis protein CapC [Pseudoalteromonas sp. S1610]